MIGFVAFAAAAVGSTDPLPVQAMQNFGTCVVSYTPRGVRDVLALDFRTREYRQRLHALLLGHDRCAIGSSIGSSELLFAGSLAEAMLKADVKPNDLVHRLAFEPSDGRIEARSPTEAMALCTVLAAPQQTTSLLATQAGSSEERSTLQPLVPYMTNCSPENMKLTANRSSVRALLALAAWRVASTPRKAAQ